MIKYVKRYCLCYFGINISHSVYHPIRYIPFGISRLVYSIRCKYILFGINMFHSIFFGERAHCNFGKVVFTLSVAPTVSCAAEQSFSILRRPKTNLRSTMRQDRLSIWQYYVLNVLMSTD